ncbi:MAG: GIY-YIG nuclease family protein [Planctomycetales bacterium]|nr:GIY-YIG nuclease family protein [Planctomycetales bacterium]
MFLNYSREPIPEIHDQSGKPRTRDLATDQKIIVLIVAAVIALMASGLVALISGNLTAFFAISCAIFIAGIVGVSIFLDARSKLHAMQDAAAKLDARVRFHEEQQLNLVQSLKGFHTNFTSLVDAERAALHSRFDKEQAELEHKYNLLMHDAQLDREQAAHQLETASEYASAASEISKRLFTEVRKSIKSKLTPNNYTTQKDRFMKMVAFCEKKGYPIDEDTIRQFEVELKNDFEEVVRTQFAKEEQARIREKIREEQKAERELEKELKRIEAERRAIEKAIAAALERTHDEHSAEVEELRQKLADAEARSQRAISMAQQTRAGNVYVISNFGSFGEGVFKIGLTRRLEPLDRVKELGDASVPFPFDVHMMISCDDAPALETALHREFTTCRVNRVNMRKEFFRVSIEEIAQVVERCHGKVDYIAEPEALEYNESLRMTDEDFAFVSSQVDPETLAED